MSQAAIVVATDFSAGAGLAVRRAARIARQRQAPLVVVHVFNDSLWSSLKAEFGLQQDVVAHTDAAAREALLRLCRELSTDFSVPVSGEMLYGRAASAIAAWLATREVQLLVVGEHGENWLRDAVLGGTALKLLENAQRPVLLVRRSASGDYTRLFVATDFSDAASRAVRQSLELFPDAQHTLLHAYNLHFEGRMRLAGATDASIETYRERERQSAERHMQAFATDCNFLAAGQLRPMIVHGYPATVVLEQSNVLGADLIVIGKHGGSVVEERLLGSVTQNVLYHAVCDVLLVP